MTEENVYGNKVFPTQVGVILSNAAQCAGYISIPHASGGDPIPSIKEWPVVMYSPRKWG